MRIVFAELRRVTREDLTLLLEGETGTGKELAARAVHAYSSRRFGPFRVVDCPSLNEQPLERALFGPAGALATAIEHPRVQHSMVLGDGGSIAFEISLPQDAPVGGKTLRDIGSSSGFPRAAVVAGVITRDGPLVVAHVGASAPSRRYPAQRFAEALDLLVSEQRARVVLTGDSSEVELVEFVRGTMRSDAYTLAGCLDFAELCAVIEGADVLVSNNTAPVHIAAAVGTPVVDLYALTNPQHGPWRVPRPHRPHARASPPRGDGRPRAACRTVAVACPAARARRS